MFVFTPSGQLAFVTTQLGELSQVLLLETYSRHVFRTSELRALMLAAA